MVGRPLVPGGWWRRWVSRAPAAGTGAGLLRWMQVVVDAVVVMGMIAGEVRVLGGRYPVVLRAEAETRVAAYRVLVGVHGGVLVQLQVAYIHLSR